MAIACVGYPPLLYSYVTDALTSTVSIGAPVNIANTLDSTGLFFEIFSCSMPGIGSSTPASLKSRFQGLGWLSYLKVVMVSTGVIGK